MVVVCVGKIEENFIAGEGSAVCSDITSQDFIEANHLNYNIGMAIDCIVEANIVDGVVSSELIVKAINHLVRELNHNHGHIEEWKKYVVRH